MLSGSSSQLRVRKSNFQIKPELVGNLETKIARHDFGYTWIFSLKPSQKDIILFVFAQRDKKEVEMKEQKLWFLS